MYVAGPIAGSWNRQGQFRLYEYRDGKVGFRTQYLETKQVAPLTAAL